MTHLEVCLAAYLILTNLYAWLQFTIDKWKAIHGRWRISERMLLGMAFIGGSLGALVAMYMFRHKTTKKAFTIGIPIFLVLHIAALIALWHYGFIFS